WPSCDSFHAHSVLAQYPQLQSDRSVLVELAYEEFCRLVQRGESVNVEEFARQFPEVEHSLVKQLHVEQYLQQHSELMAGFSDDQWPSVGEVFLGFERLEEIGRGAFSRVLMAADRNLGHRSVVVKVCQRGSEEAQLLGQL